MIIVLAYTPEGMAFWDSLVYAVVFGLLVGLPISLIISRSRKKKRDEAESIQRIQDQLRSGNRTAWNEGGYARPQDKAEFERREKEKYEAFKAEQARKAAEEAQQKADALLLAAMNELESGCPDKLTWGRH